MNKEQLIFLGIFALFAIIVITTTFVVSSQPPQTANLLQASHPEEEYSPTSTDIPKEPSPPAPAVPSTISHTSPSYKSESLPIGTYSDGRDWNRAGYGEKMSYCNMMASRMNSKFSSSFTGSFFYGSLEEFYNSESSSVLNTKCNEIIALTVSAALN